MIIKEDSPFRNLPAELNRKQLLYLDGIRFTVEIVDFAYQQLQEILHKAATSKEIFAPSSMHYAWSFVDTFFRLRRLLEQMPGVKKQREGFQLFLRRTKEVENFRHVFQHLDKDINEIVEQNIPVWGSLSWIVVMDQDKMLIRSCVVVPGPVFTSKDNYLVNPIGKVIDLPAGEITLQARRKLLNLSGLMISVRDLIKGIEPSLRKQFEGLPTLNLDLLVTTDITPSKDKTS